MSIIGCFDYTDKALSENLSQSDDYNIYYIKRIVTESAFILESLDTGKLEVLSEEVKHDFIKSICEKIKVFFNDISDKFRQRSIEKVKKYKQEIINNMDEIKKNASNISINASPYWKSNYDSDINKISSSIKVACDSISSKRNDYNFLSPFTDIKDPSDSELVDHLKNYFRFGVSDKNKSKPVDLTGSELSKHIDSMIDYVINFDKLGEKVKSLTKKIDSLITSLENNITSQAMVKESYLLVENRTISDSTLVSCFNYNVLKEDDSNKTEVKINDNKDVQSPTKVTSKDDANKQTSKPASDDQSYANNVLKVLRLIVSSYLTAAEERFLVYFNIINKVNGKKELNSEDKKASSKKQLSQESINFINILDLVLKENK